MNKLLETKTIPSLEFQALTLGMELLLEQYNELSASKSMTPIKITSLKLFSDSAVCLNWLNNAYLLRELDPFAMRIPVIKYAMV